MVYTWCACGVHIERVANRSARHAVPTVTTPPAAPNSGALPVTELVITNAAGVVTFRLTASDAPAEGTVAGIHKQME